MRAFCESECVDVDIIDGDFISETEYICPLCGFSHEIKKSKTNLEKTKRRDLI